jgi:hypothetical protein
MGDSVKRLEVALRWALLLSLAYGALSFAWSALGLLTPTEPAHLHEYPLRGLLVEIGGHVLFGLAAALPTLDIGLILLCGGEAIVIDADHLMGALNLPVQTRLSHSIGFAIVGPLVMGWVARKNRGFNRTVMLVTFASVMAHISYDVFAGNGSVPFLDPASIGFLTFPYWTWVPFEAAALAICAYVRYSSVRGRALSSLKAIKVPEPSGTR